MQTVLELYDLIEHESKTKAVQEKRLITIFPVGKHIRQGDVYLIAVDGVPATHIKVRTESPYQCAPGETQGSRHVIQASQAFKIYSKEKIVADELEGPVIVSEKSFTLTHPEHAHFELPAGSYQVRYQLDYSTKERVRD